MEETVLYQRIAESIRKDILQGRYQSGDRLPTIRQMCATWKCTPGTIQRAYTELAREGLLVSRVGRGTQVVGTVSIDQVHGQETLRKANLVNRLETSLLEAMTSGYTLEEIQQAMDLAMDRWRTISTQPDTAPANTLRFAGSHDMAINDLAHAFFGQHLQDWKFDRSFVGSLGGLIALSEGHADIAGCHLWDSETDTYNLPFVRRLLPGRDVTVITFAHRRQGLILPPGNPLRIQELSDLTRPGIRFVNRQPGSGTRVWLDAQFSRTGIDPKRVLGYTDERLTHTDVARAVARGDADVALGLESAGRAYGLDFIFLNRERYDLIFASEAAALPGVQKLVAWLASAEGKQFIEGHPGYEGFETGNNRNLI